MMSCGSLRIEHRWICCNSGSIRFESLADASLFLADVGQVLRTEDEKVRKEVKRLRSDMDELHVVHSKLSGEIKRLQDCHGRDQAKIKRLTGQHLGAAKLSAHSLAPELGERQLWMHFVQAWGSTFEEQIADWVGPMHTPLLEMQ
jgi:hypothetical protein